MDFLYEIFPTATEHMVILEERDAAKQDKAFSQGRSEENQTRQSGEVCQDRSGHSKAARTIKTSYATAYLARILKSGRNIT